MAALPVRSATPGVNASAARQRPTSQAGHISARKPTGYRPIARSVTATASAGSSRPVRLTLPAKLYHFPHMHLFGSVGHSAADAVDALLEPIEPRQPSAPSPSLMNEDFAPVGKGAARTFSVWDFTSLWIGLVVCLPTYYLAAMLVDLGFSWWQGVGTVFISNLIVLAPMILNAHPGTKYGLPFPVISRAAFGTAGAHVPSVLRAVVGCGWFGIQSWLGGEAIFSLLNAAVGYRLPTAVVPWLGASLPAFGCFAFFWAVQVAIIVRGIESIKLVEKYSAPLLVGLSLLLLGWAVTAAGGWGPILFAPSQFGPGATKAGLFWVTLLPAITANVGFWATLSLNIPDFTRYAQSQKAQVLGQAVGLPVTMAAFSFLGLAVTSATAVIFGRVVADPIEMLSLLEGGLPRALALVGLILATLTTNIAANVVAPANAFVNVNPSRVSFTSGALLTAALGVILQPWRLIATTKGFIYTWLIGYSALLGPIGGIVIADYFVLRKRVLDVDALYTDAPSGAYHYNRGVNWIAMAALVIGAAPSVPGFLAATGVVAARAVPPALHTIYSAAWFVGFTLSFVSYLALTTLGKSQTQGSIGETKTVAAEARSGERLTATQMAAPQPTLAWV